MLQEDKVTLLAMEELVLEVNYIRGVVDLLTFYEIKAEDLPPFGNEKGKIFMLGKYSDI